MTESAEGRQGDCITVHVVEDPLGLEALRAFWSTVCKHPDVDIDFYQRVILMRQEVISPFVLVAARGAHPIAMFVGRLENGDVSVKCGKKTIFRLRFRELVYVYEGFLGERSEAVARAFMEEILGRLKAGEACAARIANLTDDCAMRRFALRLPAWPLRDHAFVRTEHWKGTVNDTLDAFIAAQGKQTRRQLRRRLKRFNRDFQGRSRFEYYHQVGDIPRFCSDAEVVARTTYQRAMGVGFCNSAEDHHRLRVAAEKGWWLAYVLFVDGRPVSFVSGRVLEDLMIADWTAYDAAFHAHRVGTIVALRLIEHGCGIGVRELDCGIGPGIHKETFSDRNEPKSTVRIYAPCSMGLYVAILCTSIVLAKKAACSALKRLSIFNNVKRVWRRRLAALSRASTSTM